MRTILDYIFCFVIKRLPPCKLERWMIRQLVTWIKRQKMGMIEKKEATYQYLEEAHGNGMFFYTSCCGNRMYSVDSNSMKYHGCLCPRCFWHNKLVTLYLRGTPDGIRVFETEHVVKAESDVANDEK